MVRTASSNGSWNDRSAQWQASARFRTTVVPFNRLECSINSVEAGKTGWKRKTGSFNPESHSVRLLQAGVPSTSWESALLPPTEHSPVPLLLRRPGGRRRRGDGIVFGGMGRRIFGSFLGPP